MTRRQTLATEISLSGVGLQSGLPVRMRLVPAEAETGIVFVRTDADGAILQ
jgi:UDP-3-O-[3-hydroxymyristoyl] N-acetylglucosamine deacetylase